MGVHRDTRRVGSDWPAKVMRLSAFVVLVVLVGAGWGAQSARARLDEKLVGVGLGMMRYTPARSQDAPRTLRVNGQAIRMSVGTADGRVEEVLDYFESACIKRDGRFAEWIEELDRAGRAGKLSQAEASMWDGTLRHEEESGGYVACLDVGSERLTPEILLQRIGRFSETGDVSDVGHLRYVFAKQLQSTRVRFVGAWVDGPLPVNEMFPAESDAPGLDIDGVPRPPEGRRTLSAWEEGQLPYAVTQYAGVGSGPGELRSWYQDALGRRGWRELSTERQRRGPPTLVVEKGRRQVALTFGRHAEGQGFVNVLAMH